MILFASCSLVCSGVQPGARSGSAGPGNFLERSSKTTEGSLTFPPPEADRTARGDLGRAGVKGSTVALAEKAPEPASPSFVVAGRSRGMSRRRARVTARVERMEWKYVQRRGAGGALRCAGTGPRGACPRGTAASAPHVHATVTLLPLGAKGEGVADDRIGAVRIPVALEGARLQVALKSDKGAYEPGEEAEITVDVSDDGKPEGRAEIALAVVDEGILRLTGFHAVDPVPLLHPGRALSFKLRDSRRGLAELFERSHTAGDGGPPPGARHAIQRALMLRVRGRNARSLRGFPQIDAAVPRLKLAPRRRSLWCWLPVPPALTRVRPPCSRPDLRVLVSPPRNRPLPRGAGPPRSPQSASACWARAASSAT